MCPEVLFGKGNTWKSTDEYAVRIALLIQRSLKSHAARGKDGTWKIRMAVSEISPCSFCSTLENCSVTSL